MSAKNHHALEVGAGETVVDGKTQWTDFVVVNITNREDAFDLAMELLRAYDQGRFQERSPISINLTGVLRPVDD